MLDSLVRVSRRGDDARYLATATSENTRSQRDTNIVSQILIRKVRLTGRRLNIAWLYRKGVITWLNLVASGKQVPDGPRQQP